MEILKLIASCLDLNCSQLKPVLGIREIRISETWIREFEIRIQIDGFVNPKIGFQIWVRIQILGQIWIRGSNPGKKPNL